MKQNTRKIKILFFVPVFNGGGAEKVMALLINKFNRQYFEVVVVTFKKTDAAYDFSADKSYELKTNRVLFSVLAISRVIKKEKPDYLFSTLTYVNTYIGLCDYVFKFRTILVARESTIPSINNRKNRLGLIYDILMLIAYKKFKLIICQSEAMKNDLSKKFNIVNEKLIIINNPVLVKDVIVTKQRSEIPIFITVAMLRKEKGIDRILKALVSVRYEYKYFVIGDGPERSFLEKKVNDWQLTNKVFFKGFSKTPDKYLKDADVYLQGSYYEGFPNVILEAGSLGVPALVFDSIGGTNEIIKNGLNGLIVKDGSDFTSSLNKTFWNMFDRERIIQHTKSAYDIDVITQKYQNIFLNNF